MDARGTFIYWPLVCIHVSVFVYFLFMFMSCFIARSYIIELMFLLSDSFLVFNLLFIPSSFIQKLYETFFHECAALFVLVFYFPSNLGVCIVPCVNTGCFCCCCCYSFRFLYSNNECLYTFTILLPPSDILVRMEKQKNSVTHK